jgi:phosphatidate cytidylyltransferase
MAAFLVAYVSFVALREMFTISALRNADRIGLFFSYLAIPVQYYFAWQNQHTLFLIFIPMIMFIIIPFSLVLSGNMSGVGRSMTIIPSLLILTVLSLGHVVMILHFDFPLSGTGGSEMIVYLIVLTAFNDVFQFVFGKLFGRHKVIPLVSPNKTWEGMIGGVFTTACLGYGIKFLTPFSGLEAFVIALSIGIFGFIGDSMISAVKRDLKLKDTGNLIPGHGGAMDRLDSLFLTAPVFYHVVYFMYS